MAAYSGNVEGNRGKAFSKINWEKALKVRPEF
jgi:hypothetical protein